MDNETKQLYKTVVKDLSRRAIVNATPSRVSFAVANLFKGIRETYYRNVERLKNLRINIAAKAENVADTINASFQTLTQNNESKREFINSFGENDKVQEAIDDKIDTKYAEDVQRKEELLASIQRDNGLVNAGAGFIIDAYQADVTKLKDHIINEKTKPHRLLVNKMFLNQFKDAAAAKRIRLRERKKLKIAVAREVRNFDNTAYEIRKRYADNSAMALGKIEEERKKLGDAAIDFITLREGLGNGVTDKEVWNAYFIGIDEMEVGIPAPEVTPIEPVAEQELSEVQPVEPTIEEPAVAPEVAPVEPMVEEPVAVPEVAPVAQPVEPNLNRDELNQNLVNVLNNIEQKALDTPVGQIITPTEEPVAIPEVTPVEPATPEVQPVEPTVEEPVAVPEVTPVEPTAPEVQPISKEPSEVDTLLSGIDTLRAGYRDELNDGYNYTDAEKKEWEDARLAEDIAEKDTNLSYAEQEATVLSYEQGLKEQREAIAEMEKQLAIIKDAEQKIMELSKTINHDLLKQVKGESAPEQAAPEIEPEGISR